MKYVDHLDFFLWVYFGAKICMEGHNFFFSNDIAFLLLDFNIELACTSSIYNLLYKYSGTNDMEASIHIFR